MKIISFDCGTQNLSWCLYDSDQKSIIDWQLQDITHPLGSTMNEFLFKKLDSWGFKDITRLTSDGQKVHVVIEKQPYRNAVCKNIEAALLNYFILRGKVDIDKKYAVHKVCTFNPKKKLAGQKIAKGKKAYAERKQRSIDLVEEIDAVKTTKWSTYLKSLKKKDDVCDALLQAVAYCGQTPDDLNKAEIKRIIARKPKENCKDLTPANIKYLLKQLLYPRLKKQRVGALQRLPANLEQNKDLKSAITSRYPSLDSALQSLGLIS